MNVKLRVLSAGALFFLGQAVFAQTTKRDTLPKEKQIEEVIVTGYRTKKADEIIQAQSVVSSKEFSQQQATLSMTNMLQGKAPGVLVQASSGQPGNGGSITIRGFSGLSNSDPLVVIDGMYSSIAQYNALNPSDVESVTILKDAASTSQYGSRASSGVLVVTTKKGISGKTSYMFQTRFGFSKKVSDKELNFQMMDANQKLNWENSIADAVGIAPYTPSEIAELSALNHDWQKDVLQSSSEESYLFSASGGNNKNLFYYSLGYDHNSGIIRYLDGLKRYTARFNFESQLSDKLRMGVNTSLQYQITQNQRDRYNAQNPIYFMYAANPYETVFDADGEYNLTGAGFPVLGALQNNPNYNKNLRLNGSLFGEYKFTNYLKFRSTLLGTYAQLKTPSAIYKGSYLDTVLGYNGWFSLANNDIFNYTINNRLDFDKSFGSHNISATAFHEFYYALSNTLATSKQGINNPKLDPFQMTNYATPLTATGTKTVYTLNSFAGLLDYNFDKKYFASASLRTDASSRFGENNKYGTFWSVSGGWNIAKENFLADTKLSTLKLRASYGTVGNDAPIPDYQNYDYASFGLYGTTPTTFINTVGNPDLKWEVAKMQNYGVDFVYANRLRGSLEYFITKRSDFLQQVSGTDTKGGYVYYSNVGDLENKGIEAELSYDVIKNSNWSWNVHGNISNVKNKLLALKDGETERITGAYNDSVLKVGEVPYLFKMVRYAGVNPDTGEALYYTNRETASQGETFYNLEGGKATNVYNGSDAQILDGKSPFPKVFGGFGTSFSYQNFDLSAEFTYKYGGWAVNMAELDRLDPAQYNTNKSTDAVNFWQKPGDTNVLPKPTSSGLYSTDYFLQKTDYIRFRSLSLGYTFDKNFLGDKSFIESFRVYIQGQNLYIWTKFKGDPEAAVGLAESNTAANTVPNSYYAYTYPIQKTFSIGFDIKF
ncbi:SusC/RagA family TonB-linked outer membrane protein [Chryseobacterium populi]|uniref:TonB-linked outer membrane protein, SusC/RagA family n=1 Tax=Chryseobacterium populi TaxID=1144316 RepID=J2SQ44_9FLAO|nr:SusC/RagA family TonB-linked outer membrane protein [Chryseobacterium populi]EJL67627.1 TonB-linked outer membrane protein, SusC/RagA family [Chryseobacterium populi]